MELDVSINGDSLSVTIDNPFRLDMEAIMEQIEGLITAHGTSLNGLDIEGLLPRMVKGIAGCEDGCPANAKSLVTQGYNNFTIEYIEGGILSAKAVTTENQNLELKMFPDF